MKDVRQHSVALMPKALTSKASTKSKSFPVTIVQNNFQRKDFYLSTSCVHQNIRSNCEVCDQSFAGKESLRKHMFSIHEGKTFKCDQCGKTYSQITGLSRHKRIVHKGFTFMCEVCCKEFKHFGSFKSHQKNHQ